MKVLPAYPALYQINTRVWLTELSRTLGRAATLDDIPDTELDRVAGMGFDWVWFLSVWRTGAAAQRISRSNPEWRREFEETLPDLREEDIGGSGFAITGYTVHPGLGGDAALARLRAPAEARAAAAAGLRSQPHGAGSSVGGGPPGVLRGGDGARPGAGAAELYAGHAEGGRPDPGLWAGPVLRRLAGHAAARLQQAGHAGGDDRGAAEDRRPM